MRNHYVSCIYKLWILVNIVKIKCIFVELDLWWKNLVLNFQNQKGIKSKTNDKNKFFKINFIATIFQILNIFHILNYPIIIIGNACVHSENLK
jgi:hypothetical protein